MVRATTTDIEKTVQDVTKNVFIRPPEVQKRYLNTPKPHWISSEGKIICHQPYKKYLRTDIADILARFGVNDPYLEERELIAQVFPFKINEHTLSLIDWKNFLTDPVAQLIFPQPGMLAESEIDQLRQLKHAKVSREIFAKAISDIRQTKNPAPANQSANRPTIEEGEDVEVVDGIQHKYSKTMLMFHKNAQTCHAYCTYCFRFNQFVGKDPFLEDDAQRMLKYVKQHPEITDILMTGGDPATMATEKWKECLLPLLEPEYNHIKTIRMGTKALTYYPYRFLTAADADELIDLFKLMTQKGKHISIMAHFSHYNEMGTICLEATKRLRQAGCVIRTQAPLMKHINNAGEVWAEMWQQQVSNGLIPYYMFVARDTGPQKYFEVTLAEALTIYQTARKELSGLGHTARGPSMSCSPGKVCVIGRETISNEDVFVLKFLQGRNADWTDRVFFAKYCNQATWIDQLKPAFGDQKFFFEDELKQIIS